MSKKHVSVVQLISGSGALNQPTTIGSPNDRGCVSCATVYQGEAYTQHNANVTLIIDGRGRYWCLDCAVGALTNVQRRVDERADYDYPWKFSDTGGLHGQHARVRSSKPEFSYQRLPGGKATVTCTCGWQDPLGPMPVSPFDPAEALAAARAEHPCCPDPEKS